MGVLDTFNLSNFHDHTFDDITGIIMFLESLKAKGITAYLAGGWLRDQDNGIETKDVDIFLTGSDHGVRWKVEDMLHYDSSYYGNYNKCDMRDDVIGVLKSEKQGVDVILMEQESIVDIIDNFDTSICQIYGELVDSKLKVYASKEYLDWKDKGIIYAYIDIPTSQDHLDRVEAKFNVKMTPIDSKKNKIEMVHIATYEKTKY